jgi:hypothetical protein
MTPEQFYIARVMGHRFHHISQEYNFEPQYHGGVPLTSVWRDSSPGCTEIACMHFSGGSPLKTILENPSDWGCQTEKYYVKKKWDTELDEELKTRANERAKIGFAKWAFNFASACMIAKSVPVIPDIVRELCDQVYLEDAPFFRIGQALVTRNPPYEIQYIVRPPAPRRPPPCLVHS